MYGHPPDAELGRDRHGVFWLPAHAFPHQPARRHRRPAVFVSWRCYALAALGGPEALNYLWRAPPALPPTPPPIPTPPDRPPRPHSRRMTGRAGPGGI